MKIFKCFSENLSSSFIFNMFPFHTLSMKKIKKRNSARKKQILQPRAFYKKLKVNLSQSSLGVLFSFQMHRLSNMRKNIFPKSSLESLGLEVVLRTRCTFFYEQQNSAASRSGRLSES